MKKLNRRHFLKTAGLTGAGLAAATLTGWPVAGLIARAQGDMAGQVFSVKKGPVTLHTYVAPENSVLVTTHIIETAKSLVVVDAQFLQSFAKEARGYTDSLKKPIERLILSHAHPDHWLANSAWGDAAFQSTETVAKEVQAALDGGILKQQQANLGPEVDNLVRTPEGSLKAGAITIDGVAFEIEVKNNAEATEQIVIKLPEAKVVILQDLLYSNAHFFPGMDRKNWISILESLRTLKGYDTVLAGHGLPAGLGALDNAIEYLTFANETVEKASSAEEVSAALAKRYPTYGGAFILTFWPQFFKSQ
jgi:glyoxylase-like metal-dependent hydrolase (beta-lactamase superfamily II)